MPANSASSPNLPKVPTNSTSRSSCCSGRMLCSEAPIYRNSLRVQLLQGSYVDFTSLQRGDTFGSGAGGGQRGDRRDARCHSGAADSLFVEKWVCTLGRVDDQLNAVAFDQIDHV